VDPAERRTILARLLDRLDRAADLDAWVRESPLVEVEILDAEPGPAQSSRS
jgi:hypothetical protein